MKWWIKRAGRMEGPLSEEEIRKRIRLNLLGSLDRVSEDGNTWKYLKDSELWRPAVPKQVSPPVSPIESIGAPSVIHPSVRAPIPERLQMPRQEVSQRGNNRVLIWGLLGGLAVLLIVLICVGVVMLHRITGRTPVAENAKSDANSVFTEVKDKIALIKCKEGSGTGFLLGMDGKTYLVSNEHVVRSGGEVEARLIDGTILQLGEFSVASDGRDLARFEVLGNSNKPLALRTAMPNMNEQVTMYGNSLGGGVATESRGFVQGVGPRRLETNVEIVKGNSGSPIIDTNGEVVGVAAFMELTDSGREDWSNANTRYDGKVRRFAVRLSDLDWKTVNRREYEAQIRALSEFETYWEYLVPFLLFDSRKVNESKLTYKDMDGRAFHLQDAGFDEMLKAVAKAYEKRGKMILRWTERTKARKELVQRLNVAIDAQELSKKAAENTLKEYDDKTVQSYEKMKEALRAMILVRKEALSHAQSFLNDHSWDAPQVTNGYDDDPRESVGWFRDGCRFCMELMNQKLKDLNKDLKDFEQGDYDDDEN